MSLDSVLTMIVVLGGVWGGFIALLIRAGRSERGRREKAA